MGHGETRADDGGGDLLAPTDRLLQRGSVADQLGGQQVDQVFERLALGQGTGL